jgi:hypothetical protein
MTIHEVRTLLGTPLTTPMPESLYEDYSRESWIAHQGKDSDTKVKIERDGAICDENELLVLFVDNDGSRDFFAPTNLWYPHSLFEKTGLLVGNQGRFRIKGCETNNETQGPILIWRRITKHQ